MAKQDKTRFMLILSLGVVALSVAIHLLHRVYNVFGNYLLLNNMNTVPDHLISVLNILFVIPILLALTSVYIQLKETGITKYIPLLHTLTLTFGSISIIAGGNGMVEYHFSIFMVLAIISYYESIKLIVISTVIFACQHLLGYFIAPELICGTNNYHFGLLMIHAIFLIFTSGATILHISTKKKYTMKLEKENEEKEKGLRQVLSNLSLASKKIKDTSTTLSENVKITTMENVRIMDAMHEVTTSTQHQSAATKESSVGMTEMSIGTQKVAESSGIILEQSQLTVQAANDGNKYVESAVFQMEVIHQSVQELADTIMMLRERTNRIDQVVQVIGTISDQTNILSLNAAIEAARVGEQGKGFAVVADEVRKLAKQTRDSAEEITELVRSIHKGTDATVGAMDVGIKSVSDGIEAVHQVGESFKNIFNGSELIASQIAELSAIAEEMAASGQQVSAAVETISFIAENNESKIRTVAHSIEEQQKGIEETSAVSDTLLKMSDELEELMKKFTVK